MQDHLGLVAPAKLLEVPIFYYGYSQFPLSDGVSFALLSERLDFGAAFREYGQVMGERNLNGFPLWCDEVAVSVHLADLTSGVMPASNGSQAGGLSALPTFTSTTLRMEAVSMLAAVNQTPKYIVANEPEDVTLLLNNGYGVLRSPIVPANRVVRFRVAGSVAIAAPGDNVPLVIEVTARCKNLAPLLAMLEKAWGGAKPHLIERPLNGEAQGIVRSLVPSC